MNYFNQVKTMHEKFGFSGGKIPKALSKEEYIFRIRAMYEELFEYVSCIFDITEQGDSADSNAAAEEFAYWLSLFELKENVDSIESLEEQLDALTDLCVFTLGTAERQGFRMDKAFIRVMEANMKKELAVDSTLSKRDFELDLIKPKGWKPPVLTDLVTPLKGVIVLEGPDGAGKTTLATHLIENYNAEYMHLTWTPELEKQMDSYQFNALTRAEAAVQEGKLVIIDRHWISELIYASVYREGTNYPSLSLDCFNILKNMGALYVMCLPSSTSSLHKYLDEFEKLKGKREEMYSSMEECVDAYLTFTFGDQYRKPLDKKMFKSQFMSRQYKIKQGFMGEKVPIVVYDRFAQDNSYDGIIDVMNEVLGGKI